MLHRAKDSNQFKRGNAEEIRINVPNYVHTFPNRRPAALRQGQHFSERAEHYGGSIDRNADGAWPEHCMELPIRKQNALGGLNFSMKYFSGHEEAVGVWIEWFQDSAFQYFPNIFNIFHYRLPLAQSHKSS